MKKPAVYRQRPLALMALQWRGCNLTAMEQFTRGAVRLAEDGRLVLCAPEGETLVADGAWVVKGVAGEFYTVRDKVFRAAYVLDGQPV